MHNNWRDMWYTTRDPRKKEQESPDLLQYKDLFTNSELNLDLRWRMVRYNVFSTLMYECESWTLDTSIKKKMESFESYLYRRMLRVSLLQKITNTKILTRMKNRENYCRPKRKKKETPVCRPCDVESKIPNPTSDHGRKNFQNAISWTTAKFLAEKLAKKAWVLIGWAVSKDHLKNSNGVMDYLLPSSKWCLKKKKKKNEKKTRHFS